MIMLCYRWHALSAALEAICLRTASLEGTKGVPRNGGRKQQLVWSHVTFNSLHIQTLMLTDVQNPFLGTPLVVMILVIVIVIVIVIIIIVLTIIIIIIIITQHVFPLSWGAASPLEALAAATVGTQGNIAIHTHI